MYLRRQLLGAVRVLVDEEEPAAERLGRRVAAVHLAVDACVRREVLLRPSSHGFWGMTSTPTPSPAMIGIDSGDTAAA